MALESKLQKKIIENLKKSGWIPLKVITCNLSGFSDIIAFKDGRSVFIEAKAPGKKANPLQELRHEQLKNQNFAVFVINTWEQYLEAKKELSELGY